jgi:hypothetical protein
MYFCKICNYLTSTNHGLKNHFKTQKHINLVFLYNNRDDIELDDQNKDIEIEEMKDMINNDTKKYMCEICNKEYKFHSGIYKHNKKYHDGLDEKYNNKHTQLNQHQSEIKYIKKENQYRLKIERLKTELSKKDLEQKLKICELENKNLQSYNDSNVKKVFNKNNINIINNNVKISKIQFLNLNFGKVIDINTFIENYKNDYGLTNQQAQTLLENYQSDGINGCITSLVHYLKKSAAQQYKELNGVEISTDNVILPFLLSDKSLREHFEKTINGKWDKTTMIDNIKKIVNITNDQVYKYHKQYMAINGSQRKRIINGVLKASGYSIISQIKNPDFYKLDSPNKNEDNLNNEDNEEDNDETDDEEDEEEDDDDEEGDEEEDGEDGDEGEGDEEEDDEDGDDEDGDGDE